ncbi:MAG TPA: lipoate--protein ligase family protein [Verrucomicrobiae bacterium]|nr:lipoate--protein ligase family protein [Verrucomicrobiae bacterium]
MKYIDLTLPTPAENLACDEALLEACEAGLADEILRFWEPQEPFVVVGYANQIAREVNLEACKGRNIPGLRRCSGGGTVLQGAGCLNYSLLLKIPDAGPLRSISGTNSFIMERHRAALQSLLKGRVHVQGHTDLTLDNLKFSGNAQRRRKNFLIFHGTFLLRFDLPLVEQFLRMPSKQPEYRQSRPHTEFLTNLNISPEVVKSALREIWNANTPLPALPAPPRELLDKYLTDEWNFKF